MAVDSKILLIGDAITADIPVKAHAYITLTGYEEDVTGLAPTAVDVYREFRYTTDSMFWSDWAELTGANLSKQTLKVEGVATIQIRYTRTGTDSAPVVEWNSITFMGEAVPITYETPTIDDSIFAPVFPTEETQKLAANLFKKLYFRGIVPRYIIRGDNRDAVEDEDYISLMRAVGHYFALFIQYFKRFDNFYNDEELMREYVRQYGVNFDESDTALADLQYLTQHLYDEVRKRGTAMIFRRKGEVLPDGDVVPIDGELIRLLRSKPYNELDFEMLQTNETGWNIGNSSPLWRGTNESIALNKTREKTEDFVDLTKYVVSATQDAGVKLEQVEDKTVVTITSLGTSSLAALGNYDNSTELYEGQGYVADADIDYEIIFSFQIPEGSSGKILFGVEGFDVNRKRLYDDFISTRTTSVSAVFGVVDTSMLKVGEWYRWRGVIHAYSSVQIPDNTTNLGFGSDLTFNNRFVRYILPKIVLESNGGDYTTLTYTLDYATPFSVVRLVKKNEVITLETPEELGFVLPSTHTFQAWTYLGEDVTQVTVPEGGMIIEGRIERVPQPNLLRESLTVPYGSSSSSFGRVFWFQSTSNRYATIVQGNGYNEARVGNSIAVGTTISLHMCPTASYEIGENVRTVFSCIIRSQSVLTNGAFLQIGFPSIASGSIGRGFVDGIEGDVIPMDGNDHIIEVIYQRTTIVPPSSVNPSPQNSRGCLLTVRGNVILTYVFIRLPKIEDVTGLPEEEQRATAWVPHVDDPVT